MLTLLVEIYYLFSPPALYALLFKSFLISELRLRKLYVTVIFREHISRNYRVFSNEDKIMDLL